uniref:Uncharacterized protein n=1 Tax=Tanacetum cinerariifolium TaxID=118510 RepID=A0A6L2M7F5_TANCI|nr:hypothetical protein [Tanacetum cinerariifolium]
MMVQAQEEMGEGSVNPTTPTIIQPSTSQPQKKQKPRKTKRKDTKLPQTSGPTTNVVDEVVNEEINDRLVRAATSTSSLEAEQDNGGGPKCQKTIGDTIPQTRVLDLETIKTTQAMEIKSLKIRVKKLEKKKRSRTHKLQRLYNVVLTARVDSSNEASLEASAVDEVSTATTTTATIDDITLAKALMEIKSEKPKATTASTTPRLKGLLFRNMSKHLYQEFPITEKRRKFFAAKREEEKRNIPLTIAQQRSIMCTYLKNMKGWKTKSLKNKSFANIQELFDKAMKRKMEDDKESVELKHCLEIILEDGDDVTINATPLSSKSPTIVDYTIHKEGKKSYFQIFRADELLLVSPFLCSDYSKVDSESEPAEQRPERHESLTPLSEFPFALVVAPLRIHRRPAILVRPGEAIPFGRPYRTECA